MDNNQQTPVTDDQELAKVLAGMNQQTAQTLPAPDGAGDAPAPETAPTETPELQFEETPLNRVEAEDPEVVTAEPAAAAPAPADESPLVSDPAPAETEAAASPILTPSASPELDSIKKDALEQLRPLVDKLDLPADEKFDTLLLVIRSTDDKTLVNAAFDAAKGITDETKRAQALLDVIKEIDYFSGHGPQPEA